MRRIFYKHQSNLIQKVIIFFGVLFTLALTAQTTTFNTQGNHTWKAPAGVIEIEVETWGGGGRGGNVEGGLFQNNNSGGGGGGAYSKSVLSVTPGQTYYINVGNGSTTAGVAGGDSWFNGLPNINTAPSSIPGVLAKGGESVSGNNTSSGALGGAANQGLGDVRYSGGNGAGGASNNGGGGGSSAGTATNGNNGSGNSGGTAPIGGGSGGSGASQNTGSSGSSPGGGGGGSGSGFINASSYNGGSGANGRVVVTVVTIDLTVDVSVYSTVSSVIPEVGQTVNITFYAVNYSQFNAATNVVLDIEVPNGLAYFSHNMPTQGSVDLANSLWNVGTLNPEQSATLSVTFTVLATGSYTSVAEIEATQDDFNIADNTNTLTLYPTNPTADLQITKQADNYQPLIGDEVVFTLKVHNNGPDTATGVFVTDMLPSGLVYVSHFGGAYNSGTGIWNIGNLAKGVSATLTITATVQEIGSYENESEVECNQFDPAENNNISQVVIYPSYESLELVLPCASRTYNLENLEIPGLPSGAVISWHTEPNATSENEYIGDLNDAPTGKIYYLAFYDFDQNCYSLTSQVKITRSCVISNPHIRQRTK